MIRQLLCYTIGMVLFLNITACEKGDYLGPVERAARELLNGWDMWESEAVKPFEPPLLEVPEGTVPITGREGFHTASEEAKQFSHETLMQKAQQAYRRYCHHCHGAHGDGRIIVGESFGIKLPDLRSDAVQQQTDEALYHGVAKGSANMIELRSTMTPLEIVLTIHYIRTLKNAPSKPFFSPKNVEPIR